MRKIPHTVPALIDFAKKIEKEFETEFVFVDDGSGDNSFNLLIEEQKKDDRIKIVKLSRNFGSMLAIQAGLANSTGDCVGIIATDLQDPVELFIDMLEAWKNGKKVILATRKDREEGVLQKLFSNIYYKLMRKFAIPDYPLGGFDFLLIDRQVVEEINMIHEKNTNIMSLIFWLGHDREYFPYIRKEREHGRSKWTLSKKVKLFVDFFVVFSYAPIRFMTVFGFFIALFSFIYGIFIIVNYFMGNVSITGWASTLLVISFFSGVIMIMLGVIGEYLWRILDETRKRPGYVIDQVYK